MSEVKNPSPDDDLSIYVSFRLVGDSTYPQEKLALDKLIEGLFHEAYSVDHEDPEGLQEREIVYRIQKPLVASEADVRQFFLNLQTIFASMKRYLPSFTQGSEAIA